MKINWNRATAIEELDDGDTFLFENELFIKTESCNSANVLIVNLADGRIEYIALDTPVMPIKAEITMDGN